MNDMRKNINLVEIAERDTIFEASLGRIFQHLNAKKPISIITAFRGQDVSGNELSKKDNLARNKKLENDIRTLGYGYNTMVGRYVENYGTDSASNVDEVSLLVVGNVDEDDKFAKEMSNLGSKYDQDSILLKKGNEENANLIGTNHANFPGFGNSVSVGKWSPSKVGEFYSKMKGKTFVFESAFKEPSSNMGRWAKQTYLKNIE